MSQLYWHKFDIYAFWVWLFLSLCHNIHPCWALMLGKKSQKNGQKFKYIWRYFFGHKRPYLSNKSYGIKKAPPTWCLFIIRLVLVHNHHTRTNCHLLLYFHNLNKLIPFFSSFLLVTCPPMSLLILVTNHHTCMIVCFRIIFINQFMPCPLKITILA